MGKLVRRVPAIGHVQPNSGQRIVRVTKDELERHIEPFYPLVGRLVIDWGMIERDIGDAAAVFSTIDLSGFGRLTLRDRVELLQTTFCSFAPDVGERAFMDRLANEILDMADVRDVIANGAWSNARKGPPFTLTFSAAPLVRKGGKLAELTVSVDDLENLLKRMAKLRSELAVFPFR
jgi:hypothetical protein